jgi:hypothetical protein
MFLSQSKEHEKLYEYISNLNSKETRYVFSIVRKLWLQNLTDADCVNIFLPKLGITLGEFVVSNVLNSGKSKKINKKN